MSTAELVATPAVALPARRAVFTRQLRSELRLLFRRRRNQALLVALALVPLLIGTAVKLSSPRPGEGPAFVSQLTGNGVFLVFTALTICLPVFLPLAVAVVGGDSIAGEANLGTLRYVLTVPVSRTRLLVVKSLGVLTYLLVAVLVVAGVGLLAGAMLFGVHNLVLLSGDTVSVTSGLLRTAGVVGYVFVDLVGLAAVAVFLSTLTEVPIGAMAAVVGVTIAFGVLDSIPQLGGFRSTLLVHHWLDFAALLRMKVDVGTLLHGLILPVSYAAIFLSAAWARLTSADVTS